MMNQVRKHIFLGVLALAAATATQSFAAFDSFGRDIPLESAAKQIVPPGYSVDYGSGVDRNATVSWGKASDWKSALSAAVSAKGLKAEIGSNTVVIVKSSESKPSESKASEKKTPRPYSSTPSHNSHKTVERKAPPHHAAAVPTPRPETGGGGFVIRPYGGAPTPPASGDQKLVGKEIVGKDAQTKGGWQAYGGNGTFVVEPGYMLHDTLDKWASATGWKVVWNSDHDYPLVASASFSGDFQKASSDLVTALKDVRPQITADYYQGNKVVVISNKLSDEVNR